jgi:alpha-tubulin suppressor-like RCC1 family protein
MMNPISNRGPHRRANSASAARDPRANATLRGALAAVAVLVASAANMVATAAPQQPPIRTRFVGWGDSNSGEFNTPSDIKTPIRGWAAGSLSYILDADNRLIIFGRRQPEVNDIPWPTSGIDFAASVAGGERHHVVLTPSGQVICWGSNSEGQCNVPAGLTNVSRVFASGNLSAAIRTDSTVVFWPPLSSWTYNGPVADLALGPSHPSETNQGMYRLALKPDGSLYSDNSVYPVPALTGVTKIAAGNYHAIVRKADGTAVAWGFNLYGQGSVPAGLGPVLAVGAGSMFSAAVRADGTVTAWGEAFYGAPVVPPNIGNAVDLRCGNRHTLVLRADGTVTAFGQLSAALNVPRAIGPVSRSVANSSTNMGGSTLIVRSDGLISAWGNGLSLDPNIGPVAEAALGRVGVIARRPDGTVWSGLYNPPANIGQVISVAAADAFYAAVKANGTVVTWGDSINVPSVPTSVGAAVEVDANSGFVIAKRTNGSLAVFGSTGTPGAPPTSLTTVLDFSAGRSHALAQRPDGTLVGWPTTHVGAQIPADLGVVRAFRANTISVAVRSDGRVIQWGSVNATTPPPPTLPPVVSITAHEQTMIAIVDDDCDRNGVSDQTELDGRDCDGNGVLDACDIIVGRMEDCDGNLVPDICEKSNPIALSSGQLSPFGVTAPAAWTIPSFVPASTPAVLQVRAQADLGSTNEFVSIMIGDEIFTTALAGAGQCPTITAWQTFAVPSALLNDAVDAKGMLRIRALASKAVDADGCTVPNWIELKLSYRSATNADCNQNGILDTCEIETGSATDENGNGILDLCEGTYASCPADFDRDGAVGPSDLAVLMSAWGVHGGLPGVDLVPNGEIDSADLAALLSNWGSCPSGK